MSQRPRASVDAPTATNIVASVVGAVRTAQPPHSESAVRAECRDWQRIGACAAEVSEDVSQRIWEQPPGCAKTFSWSSSSVRGSCAIPDFVGRDTAESAFDATNITAAIASDNRLNRHRTGAQINNIVELNNALFEQCRTCFGNAASAIAWAGGDRGRQPLQPAPDVPSTRAFVAMVKTARFVLMKSKTRATSRRFSERTRLSPETGFRTPDKVACSRGATGSIRRVR
jgi:hypothetical protein